MGFSTSVSRMRRPPGRNPTLVPSPDGTTKGLRFGYSPWPYYWLATLLIMIELSTLVLTVAVAASGTLLGIVVAVVSGALAVGVGWFLVTVLRLAPGEVTVSPAGVFHRSLTHIHFVPWYAITEVEARWLGSPIIAVKAYPSEDTGVRRYMGRFGTGELRFLPIMVIRTTGSPPTRPPSTTRCPSTRPTPTCRPSWPHPPPSTGSATAGRFDREGAAFARTVCRRAVGRLAAGYELTSGAVTRASTPWCPIF